MEHKAGRELDALIAEKVMGWTLSGLPQSDYRYLDADGGFFSMPPEYSTDIAAAWDVEGK